MRRLAWLGFAIAACGDGGGGGAPDARAIDAAATAPDAMPCTHTLFLNFGGDTLMPGLDDATTDHSSIVTGTSTLGPFTRATTSRDAITTQVQAALSPFGVDVVTARPASGDYDMILVGGTADQIGQNAAIEALAPGDLDCTVAIHDAVAFVFDVNGVPDAQLATFAIGAYGLVNDVPLSTGAQDCMCFAASSCGAVTTACTIGGANTPRDPQAGSCGTGATFDEGAAFTSALSCP